MRKLARHSLGGGGTRNKRKKQEILGRFISAGYPKPTEIVKRGFLLGTDRSASTEFRRRAPGLGSYLIRVEATFCDGPHTTTRDEEDGKSYEIVRLGFAYRDPERNIVFLCADSKEKGLHRLALTPFCISSSFLP